MNPVRDNQSMIYEIFFDFRHKKSLIIQNGQVTVAFGDPPLMG